MKSSWETINWNKKLIFTSYWKCSVLCLGQFLRVKIFVLQHLTKCGRRINHWQKVSQQCFRKLRWTLIKSCKRLWQEQCLIFLGGAPTSLCHFFHLSVRRIWHLRNRTSSNHNLWYSRVKWWYLQVYFSFFWSFYFLGC